jgi:hypothetical protein
MQKRLFYLKILNKGSEKLRMWMTEAELIALLLELKNNCYDDFVFKSSAELQIIEECNGNLTTYHFDNIKNIKLEEMITNSTH